MKKFVTLALLGSLLFGCGAAQHPVDQDVVQCRIDAVLSLFPKISKQVLADLAAGKVNLIDILVQAGGTFGDVLETVREYNACSPGNPTNPTMPTPESFKAAQSK